MTKSPEKSRLRPDKTITVSLIWRWLTHSSADLPVNGRHFVVKARNRIPPIFRCLSRTQLSKCCRPCQFPRPTRRRHPAAALPQTATTMPTHSNSSKISVYVVDDHELIRRGLTSLIDSEADMSICGQADTAAGALKEAKAIAPDLIIIDTLDGNWAALITALRHELPATRVLVLSVHDEYTHAREALFAGAHGYVMKSESFDRLLAAIRTIASGGIAVTPAVADSVLESYWLNRRQTHRLTPREREIMELIGAGESTSSIACRLGVSPKTIGTQRDHMKRTLRLKTGIQLVAYCVRWTQATAITCSRRRLAGRDNLGGGPGYETGFRAEAP